MSILVQADREDAAGTGALKRRLPYRPCLRVGLCEPNAVRVVSILVQADREDAALMGFGEVITDTSGYVTLTATDAMGKTSFNTGLNWSEPTAPHSDTNYLIQGGLEMRTPDGSGSVTFAGKSLTLDRGNISIKSRDGSTITIPDFRIYPNSIIAVGNAGSSSSLNGKMTVNTTADGPL